MTPEQWRKQNPEIFFLDPKEPEPLAAYLTACGVLESMEIMLSAERAGEGNMNRTLRVRTNLRTFIVKQSRPWVEKYPQFEAPWDRAVREIEFYGIVKSQPALAERMPELIHADAQARLLVLEDLGPGSDYSDIYGRACFTETEIELLGSFLSELHGAFRNLDDRRGLANREMRELNSQHIFFIPLEKDNGLDLDTITPGLAAVAEELMDNSEYVKSVLELASVYKADGPCLLHGDFFPGSFLRTEDGPRVIDPEFGYFGRPEFDPAVFVAHLCLGGQPVKSTARFLDCYTPPDDYDESVMLQLAGVEIMRRLIGYAQLPLEMDLSAKSKLLELSKQLVLVPDGRLIV